MKRALLILLVGLAVVGAMTLLRPHVTNCGGNSAALAHTHAVALMVWAHLSEKPTQPFRFDTVKANEVGDIKLSTSNRWLSDAHFLVPTTSISSIEPKRIVVVCDTPYRNVPERLIGRAAPAHAAGYSDGSYGLISPAEFAALDRANFVPLDQLFPPKPVL